VRNQGTQPVGVWLDVDPVEDGSGTDRVQFYLDGDRSTEVVGQGNARCLDVGQSACVGLAVDTRGLNSPPSNLLGDVANGHEMVVHADADVTCGSPSTGGPGGTEELYLTNTTYGSSTDSPGDDETTLYSVDVGSSDANLTQEFSFTSAGSGDEFNHVVAIAASPDASRIYGIDKFSDRLGVYEPGSGDFSDEGVVQGSPGSVLQAAVSPADVLYITGYDDDGLYEVDTGASPPDANEVAQITDGNGNPVAVGGHDIAFAADGTLYVMDANTGGDPVLYRVDDVSTGDAVEVGRSGDYGGSGLAVRAAGTGNLVSSNGDTDELVEIDPSSGSVAGRYSLQVGTDTLDHVYGDMAGNLE
jgi:hypothetical protein